MEEGRRVSKHLIGKPTGKRLLGRPRHKWEDYISMNLRQMGVNTRNHLFGSKLFFPHIKNNI